MDIFPCQSTNRKAMEYSTTETENSELRRCTAPSRRTCSRANRSKPGTGSTLESMCPRKECRPRPDHLYVDSGPLSSLVTQNLPDSAPTRSSGSRLVMSTSPTH